MSDFSQLSFYFYKETTCFNPLPKLSLSANFYPNIALRTMKTGPNHTLTDINYVIFTQNLNYQKSKLRFTVISLLIMYPVQDINIYTCYSEFVVSCDTSPMYYG